MSSTGKRMVLKVLNDNKNSDLAISNPEDSLNNNISISDLILLDENMQPLVSDSFIEENNNINISSTDLNQLLTSPKKVEGKLKLHLYFI